MRVRLCERSGNEFACRLVSTDNDRKDPEPELVDQVVAQQRLDEVPAAVHLQCRPVAILERRDAFSGVSFDQDRGTPGQRGLTPRRDVLGGVIQRLSARIVARVRPKGGENVVGLAAEKEIERLAHGFAHDLPHLVVPVVHRPAAVRESSFTVLLRTAWSLHDPVESHEGAHDQLSHLSHVLSIGWVRAGLDQPTSSASIWPTASRMPSVMPMLSSRSMASRVSKTVRSSIRVPPPCSVSCMDTVVVGMSGAGFPSWSANPSRNSRDFGGLTDVTRHHPRYFSPSGPVMQ